MDIEVAIPRQFDMRARPTDWTFTRLEVLEYSFGFMLVAITNIGNAKCLAVVLVA
jgi:hypothetical protein